MFIHLRKLLRRRCAPRQRPLIVEQCEARTVLASSTELSYTTLEDTPLVAQSAAVQNAVIEASPGHGSVTLQANGAFSYTPAANYDAVDQFTYRHSTGVATVSITMSPVNDPPQGSDSTVSFSSSETTFSVADFTFADPIDVPGDNLLAVQVITLPVGASLKLSGAPVVAGLVVLVANIAAGQLRLIPIVWGFPWTFTFQLQDDGGTANGGVDRDPLFRSMTVGFCQCGPPVAAPDRSVCLASLGTGKSRWLG